MAKAATTTVKKRSWDKDDLKTLRDLIKKHIPAAQIAKQLKRSEGAVRQMAFGLELSMKAKRA